MDSSIDSREQVFEQDRYTKIRMGMEFALINLRVHTSSNPNGKHKEII